MPRKLRNWFGPRPSHQPDQQRCAKHNELLSAVAAESSLRPRRKAFCFTVSDSVSHRKRDTRESSSNVWQLPQTVSMQPDTV